MRGYLILQSVARLEPDDSQVCPTTTPASLMSSACANSRFGSEPRSCIPSAAVQRNARKFVPPRFLTAMSLRPTTCPAVLIAIPTLDTPPNVPRSRIVPFSQRNAVAGPVVVRLYQPTICPASFTLSGMSLGPSSPAGTVIPPALVQMNVPFWGSHWPTAMPVLLKSHGNVLPAPSEWMSRITPFSHTTAWAPALPTRFASPTISPWSLMPLATVQHPPSDPASGCMPPAAVHTNAWNTPDALLLYPTTCPSSLISSARLLVIPGSTPSERSTPFSQRNAPIPALPAPMICPLSLIASAELPSPAPRSTTSYVTANSSMPIPLRPLSVMTCTSNRSTGVSAPMVMFAVSLDELTYVVELVLTLVVANVVSPSNAHTAREP